MNKQKGWIALYRSIQDHWLWEDDVFSRGQAWIDMILMANHTDNKTLIDGSLVTVKRGSRITSLRKLSERWGWSTTKVKKFLELLVEDGMITYKSDTKKTVYNIVNYDYWQGLENDKSNTEIMQTKNESNTEIKQKKTNNNDKQLNNEKQINNKNRDCTLKDSSFMIQNFPGKEIENLSNMNSNQIRKRIRENVEKTRNINALTADEFRKLARERTLYGGNIHEKERII